MQEVIQISELEKKKYLLVAGPSFHDLPECIRSISEKAVAVFSDFQPNPIYDNVVNGIKTFNENDCDAIIAVGGGSAIDVAKCIKFASISNYFGEIINCKDVTLITIPTTAGTGSESTKFAVIYKNGEKHSISDDKILPNKIAFYPNVLKTLSLYQKKATLLDALCHAIESYWSIKSCKESRSYSTEAIDIILNNYKAYLEGDEKTFEQMFKASNLAGKAINITTTTAGHAMAYKLTSIYGISHGHAVAIVNEKLYPFMIEHIEECVDKKIKENLVNLEKLISAERFGLLMKEMDFDNVKTGAEDFEILKYSVNTERLKNNPMSLATEEIDDLYHQILSAKG